MLKLTEKRAVYATHIERKISRHNKIVRKALATLAVPALLAASLSANADCTVTWVATLDGQPAMQPVHLIIRDSQTNAVAKDMPQKSGVFDMPCGDYIATATMGDVVRTRGMTLRSSFDLVINMGSK